MTTNNNKALPSIYLCILFDIIGCASFTIPFVGEFSDVIWAPLSGIIFYKMFGGKMGLFGGMFSFLEEILPFTDIIPTFTISWFIKSRAMAKNADKVEKSLNKGVFSLTAAK
ncbi:MAG: hypothetical protein ABJA37_02610 [Ferruginibacter sp.]